jgi:hypothetical protein
MYWARASRVREEPAGIFTDMSRLKPLWVQPSMLLARRSLMRGQSRKKATVEVRRY